MTMDSITESLSIIRARDVLLSSVVFTQPVMSLTFSEEQDFEIMRHRVEEEMKKMKEAIRHYKTINIKLRMESIS